MAENEDLPSWLRELRQQQFGDQFDQPSPIVPDREPEIDQVGMGDALRAQMAQAEEQMARPVRPTQPEPAPPPDVLDGLREQILQAEDELEYREERTPFAFAQPVMELKPPYRLLLAILLFLNVALCGCMALIMAGRVELPF